MRGDEDGFVAFARLSTPALLRAAYLMCGDRHLAEDLVQETLAKVYRPWMTGRVESPWSYSQATLLRTYVSARRRRSHSERPTAEPDVGEAPAGRDPVARLDLLAALSGLRREDRAVLVMRYMHDMSVADVASALGKRPGAVRVQTSRALERLRALMAPGEQAAAPAAAPGEWS